MLRVQDKIKDDQGILSLKYIKWVLSRPEVYLSNTIAEFVEGKENIKMTRSKLFDPGKRCKDLAGVIFPSCYYKQTKMITRKELAWINQI